MQLGIERWSVTDQPEEKIEQEQTNETPTGEDETAGRERWHMLDSASGTFGIALL
jgi:hypothetical protein